MSHPDQGDTRQVVLAYPRTIDGKDYAPDETVELPAQGFDGAKQLVREGRARWAPGTDEGRHATQPQAAEQAPSEVTEQTPAEVTEQAPAPAAEQTPAPAATQAAESKTTSKRPRGTAAGQNGE